MLVALAMIFSYVETLIPINFGIPGVKLGLANLVIVIALYKMKLTEVYLLSVVRVLLSGFIFGNYFSIIYSLAGGLLSLTVMALLKKSKGFSVMGISVAGGVFHNVGQLIVAMLVVETFSVGYYFPVPPVLPLHHSTQPQISNHPDRVPKESQDRLSVRSR